MKEFPEYYKDIEFTYNEGIHKKTVRGWLEPMFGVEGHDWFAHSYFLVDPDKVVDWKYV